MLSTDVAALIVSRQDERRPVTNLSLNKLVYFAQVESLKVYGAPLFSDRIEAWEYGPVEPAVYHAFKCFGRNPVSISTEQKLAADQLPDRAKVIVDAVVGKFGNLPAFDLVNITHREGGAWKKKYVAGRDAEITVEDIMDSDDYASDINLGNTLSAGIRSVESKWPNALRMLQDA